MSLVNITGNTQTGVIGALLILSVLLPTWARGLRSFWARQRAVTRWHDDKVTR
jgi:rhamnose transport system permease protein